MDSNEAIELVIHFLRSMEARDLETAEAMMAPSAKITFPGNKIFSSQYDVVEFSRDRYRWIKKTFDKIENLFLDNTWIVYVMGTLYGINRHGIHFSNIRYMDRFVIKNGLISQQDVWNDLAESGVLERLS